MYLTYWRIHEKDMLEKVVKSHTLCIVLDNGLTILSYLIELRYTLLHDDPLAIIVQVASCVVRWVPIVPHYATGNGCATNRNHRERTTITWFQWEYDYIDWDYKTPNVIIGSNCDGQLICIRHSFSLKYYSIKALVTQISCHTFNITSNY